mmetsp:Transcript_14010/g.42303  ORF Transcript_14010/g.42303 Transcript_14010/m.42303 type:complete len:755 (+) Transcript_14010:91-2355(+)
MGAARKIQSEIDRTLKKVQEGIDIFDEIWEKVYAPETSLNQKEKYEGDLKKEIKKLQRYRDQIKVWMSSSDVKDKGDLLAGRKSIEREMERFKLCEKEMKTKAFSKEGLGAAAKLDPREQARAEIRDWLNATVDTLNQQIDQFESEVEGLQTTGKRKSKPPPKLAHFEESLGRHRQHVLRLEQMLRLLDNEGLSVEEVTETRDMVDDYMERNQESFDEFGNPDDTYEELLDRLEGVADTQVTVPHTPAVVVPRDREKEKEKDRERAAAAAAKAQLAAHGQIRLEEDDKKPSVMLGRASNGAVRPASASIAVPGQGSGAAAADFATAAAASSASAREALSPKAAAASAGATQASSPTRQGSRGQQRQQQQQQQASTQQRAPQSQQQPKSPQHKQPTQLQLQPKSPQQQQQQQPQQAQASAPQPPQPQVPPSIQGFAVSSGAGGQDGGAAPQGGVPGAPSSWPFPSGLEGSGREALPDSKKRFLSQLQQIQANGAAVPLDGVRQPSVGSVPASPQQQRGAPLFARGSSGHQSQDGTAVSEEVGSENAPPQQPAQQQQQQQQPGALSSELQRQADGGAGSAAGGSPHAGPPAPLHGGYALPPHHNPAASLRMLTAGSLQSSAECGDRDWKPATGRPRLPPGALPPSYPQAKLPILDNPALFEKLDSEALFFSFYYQPGSYQQYLAARELKRQSWRYHKQHGAWFQRHEEPKEATDEYEKGTYVYFDYNIMHDDAQSGWCYRLKQNFTFRYDALEDES